MEPLEVYERFIAACRTGDRDAARSLSTDESWSGTGDSVRRFVEQASGVAIEVTQSGAVRQHHDRATVPAFLGTGAQGDQHVWLLLRKVRDEWLVDGFADGWPVAGLYVHGDMERPPAFSELPESEPARQWFAAFERGDALHGASATDTSALDLFKELAGSAQSVRLVRTVGFDAASRYAAAVAFEQADGGSQTLWAILQADPSGLIRMVDRSFSASINQVLRGVDPPWPPHDDRLTAPRYTAEEATELFEEALKQAHTARTQATGKESPLGGGMGSLLSELFQTMLDPDLRPQPAAESPPGSAEMRLATHLRAALKDFAASPYVDEERTVDDLHVDSAFVRDKGPELVSSLVGALTGAIVPKDLNIDLGSDTSKPDAPRVRVDLGDLLSGLFAAPKGDDR